MIHQTTIKRIGKLQLPDPQFGDFKLSVFPFFNTGDYVNLPVGFEIWEYSLNEILQYIPVTDTNYRHYVTIDSKFFSKGGFLRGEGIHADGNFCVDPNFKAQRTWGGVRTWGGARYDPKFRVVKDWDMEYDIEIPIGEYISATKGGIFCVATEAGCQAWQGEFHGDVLAEGDYSAMRSQLKDSVIFQKNTLYFMTSNTPHETLFIEKGKRRTFMRITLNHEYPNNSLPFMKSRKIAVQI